jgi:hypothetical protein
MAMRTKGAALGTATNWFVISTPSKHHLLTKPPTRIFNFMVVEITPPGIESLHWRFYIIWCVFNFSFIPIGTLPPPPPLPFPFPLTSTNP